MSCLPKCKKTASLAGHGGRRIMISEPGNEKFPIPFTAHEQCKSCAEEEAREMMEEIKLAESLNWDQSLIARYKKVTGWKPKAE